MNHNRPVWDDDRLDLSWSERRHLLAGTLVAVLFILFVTLAAAGT